MIDVHRLGSEEGVQVGLSQPQQNPARCVQRVCRAHERIFWELNVRIQATLFLQGRRYVVKGGTEADDQGTDFSLGGR
jgi:hypothetical protein